jgi:hypothetical protein
MGLSGTGTHYLDGKTELADGGIDIDATGFHRWTSTFRITAGILSRTGTTAFAGSRGHGKSLVVPIKEQGSLQVSAKFSQVLPLLWLPDENCAAIRIEHFSRYARSGGIWGTGQGLTIPVTAVLALQPYPLRGDYFLRVNETVGFHFPGQDFFKDNLYGSFRHSSSSPI